MPRSLRILLAAAAALALAACSAAPRLGDTLSLEGTLVLKGNAPMTVPVLVRSGTEQWELQQVAPATATALQNRKVQATGVVARTAGAGRLPALRVSEIQSRQ